METFYQKIIWTLFGAIVGIVLTRILDKPIERFQKKLYHRWQRIISVILKKDVSVLTSEYTIGKWKVGWVVVEGSSTTPYKPKNVICQFDQTPIILPPDRQEKINRIEKEQKQIEEDNGCRDFHNGPTLALAGIRHGQIGDYEEPELVLSLRQSNYYTFLATAMSLDDKVDDLQNRTVRDLYLNNVIYSKPIPEFASAFAVQMSVITCDGYIIYSKRAKTGIVGYPGYLAPAINECVNPVTDRDALNTISLIATVKRGASNELHIEVKEEEILFYTLGVDVKYYMYTLTGLITLKTISYADILARRSIGCEERWEGELFYLPPDLDSAVKKMRKESEIERWSPYGIVCVTQALANQHTFKSIERVLNKYPPIH